MEKKTGRFTNLEYMFSSAFLFGVHYNGKKAVCIEDDVTRKQFISYLRARNARTFLSDGNDAGFYIYRKSAGIIDSGCSCVILMYTSPEHESSNTFSVPTYIAELVYKDKEPADYWSAEPPQSTIDYPRTQCFLMNSELKTIFLNTFSIAETEIDLICPWINQHVVNESLIALMQSAVSRGVKIKITYGIGTNEQDGRQRTSEETVEMLRNRFSGTNLLRIHKGNTHIKFLICDDKYMMCGSYNFLSFSADYTDGNERDEGMEYIVDTAQIKTRRSQLFSWE